VTEALTLEGGIRVTDEKKEYTFGRLNPNGIGDYLPLSNANNPLTGWSDTYAGAATGYRAVAPSQLAPGTMVHAQYATGHKAGGISPRPYSFWQIRPFGAEKLNSYEVGFKADVIGRAFRVNGSAFYMDYIDYQGAVQECVGLDGNPLPADQGGPP